MNFDYEAIQNGEGKDFMLRFLPYLETRDGKPVAEVIGYRGRGYGRWEECFHTGLFFDGPDDAKRQLATLVLSWQATG